MFMEERARILIVGLIMALLVIFSAIMSIFTMVEYRKTEALEGVLAELEGLRSLNQVEGYCERARVVCSWYIEELRIQEGITPTGTTTTINGPS